MKFSTILSVLGLVPLLHSPELLNRQPLVSHVVMH